MCGEIRIYHKLSRLTKPFQRWSYARGRHFTQYYLKYFMTKYTAKFIRKRAKAGVGYVFRDKEVKTLAGGIVEYMLKHSKKDDPELTPDLLIEEIKRLLISLDEIHKREEEREEEIQRVCCGMFKRKLSPNLEFSERSNSGRSRSTYFEVLQQRQVVADIEAIEVNMADLIPTLKAVSNYALSLHKCCIKNVGLDHGKVKEYWLNRGPRMAATMLVYTLYSFIITELTGSMTFSDRIRTVLIAGMAILVAFFMLYFRLPDAISSSICRSAHDFYVETKEKDFYAAGVISIRRRGDSFND
ncbi:hypothetical protein TL16_g08111 [Triparma laevis f. inornata]|uniref:Uncharacterized protein n=1 Tax=Triparma laevis f. inornata TaxID=1714386 RepID=A0A9W7EIN8_9STRA|nr:hypothetical protein TL16_g08111 [Triparma laevis f. inornata]